ncbi:uncharacterized protein JCM15063_004655 [Sporobolomyces koalae]|uniref:uncharacterized protein n=1 Tax=Sporobolomyces koalae TaxID=500713 RepID=UPI00318111BD
MHDRPAVGPASQPQHARTYSQTNRAAGIAKQQELSTAYNALAAELTRTEIKSVGGYTLGRVIGQGTFGKVRLGVHRLTGTRVAIKQVSKSLPSTSSDPTSPLSLLTREIHHHRRLRHPHVLSLYELIATESSIYLVSELCPGGELFDYLVEKGRLESAETREIFGQIVLGIAYLHDERVVHRDLKLENILLDERCRVKIADLGFGREFDKGKWLETWVGTLGYCAPEVVSGKKYLGPEVDIWSLGVIFYALVTGSLPFDDDDEGIMKEMILKCEYEIPTWLDEDAADLIRNILVLDPLRRFSLKQILAHRFFTRPAPPIPSSSTSKGRQPTFSRSHSCASSVLSTHHVHDQIVEEDGSFDHPPSIPEQEENVVTQSPSVGFLAAEAQSRPEGLSEKQAGKQKVLEGELRLEPLPLQQDVLPSPGKLSAPPSPAPYSQSSFDPAPSLRRNRSTSSSMHSLNPFQSSTHGANTPHARTPIRTKRRSIGSIISERLVSLIEEEPRYLATAATPTSPATPRVDYLAVMSSTILDRDHSEIISNDRDRRLLDKLEALGFDTGQMRHSVENSACDSTSATYWMLKKKLDDQEQERGEFGTDVEHVAGTETGDEEQAGVETHSESDGTAAADRVSLNLPSTRVQEPSPTNDLFSVIRSKTPSPPQHPPRTTTSPAGNVTANAAIEDRLDYFLGQHSSGAPLSPPALDYFPTIDPGSPTRRRTKSRDDILLYSPLSTSAAPLVSPLELSPNARSKSEEDAKNRRSRSGSVTLLARATSALNNLGKPVRDEAENLQNAAGGSKPFRRKSSLPLEELAVSTSRTPPLSSASPPTSPQRNSSNSPFREHPSTPPRSTSQQKSVTSPGPSPAVSLANSVDTFDTVVSNTSTSKSRATFGVNGGSKKGMKGSQLLANLKFWFGEGQRKRNKRTSPGRPSENGSFGSTSIARSHSLNGGYRVSGQSGYVASPLRRPLPGSRRSSNASLAPVSRRSSVSSAHRAALHDNAHSHPHPHSRPQLAHHRRRSDSSRTSISGGDHSRPQSLRSFTGTSGVGQGQQTSPNNDAGRSTRRSRHAKAPSTSSSTGSFGKEAVYRRPPTTTTVRRRHTSHGRHNHRRSTSGASSIRTHRSSTSSIAEGGSDEDGFGEAGEAPILEEDEPEDRESRTTETSAADPTMTQAGEDDDTLKAQARLRALRTLSGDFALSSNDASIPATTIASVPAASQAARPPLIHRSSSKASSSRSDSSSTHRVHQRHQHHHATFSAHKSTHLFGSPLQPTSHRHTIPAARPPLRDVFASKSTIGDASDWIDEDELEGYGGGLGQTRTKSATGESLDHSLGGSDEIRGDRANGDRVTGGISIFEGRYAGMNGSRGPANVTGRGMRTVSAIKTTVIEEDEEEEEEE